jgi:hypothetical protein
LGNTARCKLYDLAMFSPLQEFPPPPPYSSLQLNPPTDSCGGTSRTSAGAAGSHTPPGHMLVSSELSFPVSTVPTKSRQQQHSSLILTGPTFLTSDQVHPGSLTSSFVTPSGSNCGHYSHMNYSYHEHPKLKASDNEEVVAVVPVSAVAASQHQRGHRQHRRDRGGVGTGGGNGGAAGGGGSGTFPRKRREKETMRNRLVNLHEY